jgi:hypothetical protein
MEDCWWVACTRSHTIIERHVTGTTAALFQTHLFQLLLLLLVLLQHSGHCGTVLSQLLLHISQLLVKLQHGRPSAAALRF